MSAEPPENDVAQLAAQIASIANAPVDQVPELRVHLRALANSVAAIGKAIATPDPDPAARARIADELDRVRASIAETQRTMQATIARTKPALQAQLRDVPLPALDGTLALVAAWLRAPTTENTEGVHRLVAALRSVPGGQEMWTDQAAQAKRDAELEANVQKSLDEIAADMPKFKL
jgi:hypothetical protein